MLRSASAAEADKARMTIPAAPGLTAPLDDASSAGGPRTVARSLRRPHRPGWRMAVAASIVALLLGLSAHYSPTDLDELLQPASGQPADPVAQRFATALAQLLDHGRIGDSVGYDLPEVGARGRVTLLGEVSTPSGLACREFRHDAHRAGQQGMEDGIACRSPDGGWETLLVRRP